MRINYNVSAMISNNALSNNDDFLSQSLQRLSSGLKINSAKDNPAGLAMAKRMNAQIEGLSQANQNASDGVSVIETADGAMSEITEMLQRLNELAVKSANGTMSDDDRATIQDEVVQLKEEITRISQTTEFNGQKLLNGEFEYKGYTDNNEVKVNGYSDDVTAKIYKITSLKLQQDSDGTVSVDDTAANSPDFGNLPSDTKASVKDDILTLKAGNGFEIRLDISNVTYDANGQADLSALSINVTGIGAMRLQVGANEGQVLAIEIPNISLQNMSIENLDVSTKEGANDAIDRVTDALAYVSTVRGRLGAYQNRLETSINNLDVSSENMTSAYSRIMDVDMAEEMTNYSTYQVLVQAGTSMLAQANDRPAQVLQLLQ